VFIVGDRFYGTLSAYIHEPYTAPYTYSSAMAVSRLKSLAPRVSGVASAHADGSATSATPDRVVRDDQANPGSSELVDDRPAPSQP